VTWRERAIHERLKLTGDEKNEKKKRGFMRASKGDRTTAIKWEREQSALPVIIWRPWAIGRGTDRRGRHINNKSRAWGGRSG